MHIRRLPGLCPDPPAALDALNRIDLNDGVEIQPLLLSMLRIK